MGPQQREVPIMQATSPSVEEMEAGYDDDHNHADQMTILLVVRSLQAHLLSLSTSMHSETSVFLSAWKALP